MTNRDDVLRDILLHRTGVMKDGKHIPLSDLYVRPITSRDEAMREAVHSAYRENYPPSGEHIATSGADAERKRIVEWLRADSLVR